ncbi:hypothetical protein ACVPOS_08115 [Staphylococcus aureus]
MTLHQRPARGKTIQAKTRGKSLDKSKSDDKGRKKKGKQHKGKNQRNNDKSGNSKHKPFYKDKSVKKKHVGSRKNKQQ